MILAVGFPNPVGWAIDKVGDFVGGVATQGFELLVGGLVAWVVDAVLWVVGGVFNFFIDATDPNVQADWFVTGRGPYAMTVSIGAVLLVGFVFAGITQGVLAGDVGGMVRRMALDLPLSVLGMVGLVAVTQALISVTDALAGGILDQFESDISEFIAVVTTLSYLTGGTASAFVVFVLGLVTVFAGLILVAELVVREALIYIVVALAPLVFAARLWPATKGAARRCLDLLAALILSKLVIAVALAVAAAAAVGAGSGGEVAALPPPEVFAEDPGGSTTQAVGLLLAAAAAFGVAAFSPMVIAKLLPLTEAAVVGQGLRSGPVRAGQQAMYAANSASSMQRHRLNQLAGARSGASAGGAAAGGGGAAGGAAAGAGPAGAAAAAAAAVVQVPVRAAQRSAASASTPPSPPPAPAGGQGRRPPGPPDRSGEQGGDRA